MTRRMPPLELWLGLLLAGGMVLAVLTSGWMFPDGGEAMDLSARLLPPFTNWAHPLGADPIGRDVLARVVVGGWVSLTVGVLSVLGAAAFGTAMGLVAGYYGGAWEMALMRWADVQLALPFILIAITFTAILGADVGMLILFMAISQWVQYARVVRASVLSLRAGEGHVRDASQAFEAELDALPGVLESAVIGVAHPDFGEGVTAVVVARPGATLSEQDLVRALQERVARYKVPKRVIVVAELPRNAMGKVQKNVLRQTYAALYQAG